MTSLISQLKVKSFKSHYFIVHTRDLQSLSLKVTPMKDKTLQLNWEINQNKCLHNKTSVI